MGARPSLLSNTSPAVDGDVVVVPYPSGDLVALRVSDGQAIWTESLARTRTASSMAAMSDTARPAIDGGTVFAGGHAGRMGATKQKTGERLWARAGAAVVARRPGGPHGGHKAEARRAAVVPDGAEPAGPVGGGRYPVRGRHR